MNYTNSLGPVGQTSDTPKRTPQIPEAHERLNKEIESVNGLLGELWNRLGPAMRVDPGPECAEKQLSSPPSNTIVRQLEESARRVALARDKIQDMLRLLEF